MRKNVLCFGIFLFIIFIGNVCALELTPETITEYLLEETPLPNDSEITSEFYTSILEILKESEITTDENNIYLDITYSDFQFHREITFLENQIIYYGDENFTNNSFLENPENFNYVFTSSLLDGIMCRQLFYAICVVKDYNDEEFLYIVENFDGTNQYGIHLENEILETNGQQSISYLKFFEVDIDQFGLQNDESFTDELTEIENPQTGTIFPVILLPISIVFILMIFTFTRKKIFYKL